MTDTAARARLAREYVPLVAIFGTPSTNSARCCPVNAAGIGQIRKHLATIEHRLGPGFEALAAEVR